MSEDADSDSDSLAHVAVPCVRLIPCADGRGATPTTVLVRLPPRPRPPPRSPLPPARLDASSTPHILANVLAHADRPTLLAARSCSTTLLALAARVLAPQLGFARDGAKLAICSPLGRVPALPVSEYLEWSPPSGGALAACTLLDVRGDVSRPAARLARALTRVRSVRYAPDQAGRYATRVALPRAATAVVYAAACAAPELSSARIVLGAAVSRLVLCPAGAAALPEISGGALREVVVRLSDVEEGHVPEDVGERRAWLAATVRAAAALAPAAEVALVDLAAVKPSFWGCKHQPGAYVRKFLQDEVLGAAAGVTWLSAAEYASRVGPAQLALEMAPWCGPSE